MAKKPKIEGMKELERSMKRLGKVPQKSVTKAAKAGARIPLKSARANAPVDTSDLKSGLVLKGERRKTPGKKVYQVVFDKNKNHIFVKMSKDGKRSYYPASMEYGYITRDGGYVPGYRFLSKSITTNEREIEKKMVDVLSKDIDKELGRG
jgi:hypothetical protein